MDNYILNKQKNDELCNEVHKSSCSHLPHLINQVYLDWHNNCNDALYISKKLGYKPYLCRHCCPEYYHGQKRTVSKLLYHSKQNEKSMFDFSR